MKTWRFPFEKSPETGKKGLQNRVAHDIIPRVSTIRRTDIGMSPSGKAPDFDSGISSVQIRPSQPYDPLAQQAEQLPFKQWVRGSNPRRVTKKKDTLKRVLLFGFRWPEAASTLTLLFQMLGRSEFALCQGFGSLT